MSAHAHEHSHDADGDGDADAGAPAGEPQPAACHVCLLCQVVARVQESRPEVVAHLTDAASSLAAALSELAGTREQPPAQPRARENLEHIDISD